MLEGEWPEHWVDAAGHFRLVARRGQVAPLAGMLYPTTCGGRPHLCQGILVFRLLQLSSLQSHLYSLPPKVSA